MEKNYIIVKEIEHNGKFLPVVLLDSNDEVWEFPSSDEAQEMANIFTKNSESGWVYKIKEV
jgi:hypothetical protein